MKHARPLLLAAPILALLISACSQPANVQAPGLEPQFGTANYDSAYAVAVNDGHHSVFAAGITSDYETYKDTIFLRRFNRDGSTAWERRVGPFDYSGTVTDVGTDAAGNAYLAYLSQAGEGSQTRHFLVKYSAGGTLLWRKDFSFSLLSDVTSFVVDNAGNSYVSFRTGGIGDVYGFAVRKYAPDGRQLRETRYQSSYRKYFSALALGTDGALYALLYDETNYAQGDGSPTYKLWAFSKGGSLVFRRLIAGPEAVPVQDIAAGGGGVYTVASTDQATEPLYLNKYSQSGTLLWQRRATNVDYDGARGLAADGMGNVYIAGFTSLGANPAIEPQPSDAFVRKFTASGELAWKYTTKLPDTDEVALAVAARTSGEIYTVGRTNSKVNGKYFGFGDAFLLRLNGQGGAVWSR